MADPTLQSLYSMLLELRTLLRSTGHRLVLAESCTAGLVAAELGQVPGISLHFCGSMVVYRTNTKTDWLGIDVVILNDLEIGAVSAEVTERLVEAMFEKTPEATMSAAITGHLGPNAPSALDGRVYCGIATRNTLNTGPVIRQFQLQSPSPVGEEDLPGRRVRQQEASQMLLGLILQALKSE